MVPLGHRYTEVQRRNRACVHFYVIDGDSVINPCSTRKFCNNTYGGTHGTIAGRGNYGHILSHSSSWCKGQGQQGARMQQISRRQLRPPVDRVFAKFSLADASSKLSQVHASGNGDLCIGLTPRTEHQARSRFRFFSTKVGEPHATRLFPSSPQHPSRGATSR